MDYIDRLYTDCPFYGSRKICVELNKCGHHINRKRVIRLMQKMGLQAITPKRCLTRSNKEHTKFPYLLEGVVVERPNQVWGTDITYIRVGKGYLYLTAVLDFFTRYVISWRLSNTMDVSFCVEALEEALQVATPDIFNSDQGSQYTSKEFVDVLKGKGIQISMSGKGRCFDNILVERLWRSVKYEEVYIRRYETGEQAYDGLNKYFPFYNNTRIHQKLNYQTPRSLYFEVDKA